MASGGGARNRGPCRSRAPAAAIDGVTVACGQSLRQSDEIPRGSTSARNSARHGLKAGFKRIISTDMGCAEHGSSSTPLDSGIGFIGIGFIGIGFIGIGFIGIGFIVTGHKGTRAYEFVLGGTLKHPRLNGAGGHGALTHIRAKAVFVGGPRRRYANA